MNRRHFMMSSAAALGATRARSAPSDTVRVACVGVRGRGKNHIDAYTKLPNVELVALCDIDESVLNQRLKDVEDKG
ncbi:MAG: gfo/Idh/MocA family oxidoreductase, partial [Gammaproteobacteria bacterium]